ncbi:TPA: YjfI family protein [Pseudomonas aeruginosa]|nr:YjfI family protein [Pseudomonas aeruginosa]
MQRKSSAHYQRVFRQRLREQGLVKKEVWILPENAAALAGIERMLRRPAAGAAHLEKEEDMTEARVWNARSLAEALSGTELFSSGEAQIELIEGAEASLYVIMREYGDLPVFVAPQGEQVIVEALLWPESDVTDATAFNEEVLLSRQLFPLSSIGLLNLPGEERCYSMFGALSTTSSLASVLHEIETLAGNVIRATEVYAGYLKARA